MQLLLTLYVEDHTTGPGRWAQKTLGVADEGFHGQPVHEVPFQIYVRHSDWEVFVMDQLKGFLVQEEFGGPIVEGEPGSHWILFINCICFQLELT